MRALMGLLKDRHGTYYARHKVPERLQKIVAQILHNGKPKQVWLKKSLGTKDLREANVRGKPVQVDFDRLIGRAEALLKQRPLRASITEVEIKRIAEYFYAHELSFDQAEREDTTGSDPMAASVHRQLTEAGVEFEPTFDVNSLTLEPGGGLSPRMMRKIEEDASFVLKAAKQALARGDVKFMAYEVDELLEVFQINLAKDTESYRRLARAVTEAFVKSNEAVLARHKGEPIPTPELVQPGDQGAITGGTLPEALEGWKKERNPSRGVLAEYERAIRLFRELHGDLPVVQIKRPHARSFREALQDLPRHRSAKLLNSPLPELAKWGREHPEAPKITAATANKLLGGVQTIALWAHDKGMVPDDIPWADPFAKMRLPEDLPERDAFDIHELQTLFASPVFTKGERPAPGRGEAAFWLPLLSLYTGARQSELAMLTVKDVQKVDGTYAFRFVEEKSVGKTLKTRSSARTVPVHPQLVKLGLLVYVDAIRRGGSDSAWLFPQVAPSIRGGLRAWSKWFNRTLRDIGVADKRKVFHSFRHTFKDALRAASVGEDINDALTGHSNISVGRGYGAKDTVRRFGMATLKNAVARVTYKGLNLTKVRLQPQKWNRRAS